ncbi:TIGR03032 family protein [Marinilabilia salmonicolor]|uniref:TIGR03032 family protein n=1 Tax=Marinilabilia salmonicolor TaxID=989 RepID=UPI00068412F3|nr:TIGR03032 family protein [Marinilabilia salmonicolor]
MNQPKPFDCEYSPQFAELLGKLGISLAVSTYQAGKVIVVSSVNNDRLIQLPRTFPGAMGMAAFEGKLAVANTNEVVLLRNEPSLAAGYPTKPGIYDSIYLPRASFYTGNLALHDMEFVNGKLLAVNTQFSSVSEIKSESNFVSVWQPPFISDLQPEDRCHLNGMAVAGGQIKYLTALGQGDQPHQWRESKMNGGVLMEYPSGKIILDNLSMPHSPRVYDDELYLLNSAQGELIKVDPRHKSYEVIVSLGGFARGMARYGDYLFIGVSKLRHNSPVFADLPIAKTSFAGVIAVYLPIKLSLGL